MSGTEIGLLGAKNDDFRVPQKIMQIVMIKSQSKLSHVNKCMCFSSTQNHRRQTYNYSHINCNKLMNITWAFYGVLSIPLKPHNFHFLCLY